MLGLTEIIDVEGLVYDRVLPLLDVEAPRGYWSAFDARARGVPCVITEDVGVTRGAQFCSPADELTLEQMKELLTEHGDLARAPVEPPGARGRLAADHRASATRALCRFLDWGKRSVVGYRRAGDVVAPSVRDRPRRLRVRGVRAARWRLGSEGAMTFLHGDPHSGGNFYVTADGRMGWADWGVCLRGSWGYDYAYAVTASLPTDARREWEHELLEHYLEQLALAGGEAPDFDDGVAGLPPAGALPVRRLGRRLRPRAASAGLPAARVLPSDHRTRRRTPSRTSTASAPSRPATRTRST